MTKEQVSDAIYTGSLVDCTKDEYPQVRGWIQDAAGAFIDAGDSLRGMIALREVERLDAKFDFDICG